MDKISKDYLSLLQTLDGKKLEELEQIALSKSKQTLEDTGLDDYYTWAITVWLTARGEYLDFEEHKYLLDIYQDQHPQIVFQKGAQMGISERLISEAVWICDRLGKNVLFVFPTSAQLNDFVQARIEPIFISSDYLSRITGVLSSDEKKEKSVDDAKKIQKVGLKQIRNAFLYLRGSRNEQQIISVDADAVYLDERDRFMQEHVSYIDKRLLHSTLKWRREASTPTFPGQGVNQLFLESDQRVWMLRCDECDLEQELEFFFNVDFEKKITFCKGCKEPIDRLKQGRWVSLHPDNTTTHGYKISGIYNPRRSVPELVDAYEKAKNSGFSAMQQFYNQILGLPYEADGKTLLISELECCMQNYLNPIEAKDCFAGADVGEKIHMIISKYIDGKFKYVFIGTVSEFFGPIDSVESLMNKYNIHTLVVDAEPERRKVRELIAKFPNRVFGAYYPTRKFDIQNYFMFDDFKAEVSIDRTISMDYLISDIQNEKIAIPSNSKHIPEFYEQMTSSIRVPEMNLRTGQMTAKWVNRGADHFLHASNYNRIAVQKGNINQALLESYKGVAKDGVDVFTPDSIAGWANLVRLKGARLDS